MRFPRQIAPYEGCELSIDGSAAFRLYILEFILDLIFHHSYNFVLINSIICLPFIIIDSLTNAKTKNENQINKNDNIILLF